MELNSIADVKLVGRALINGWLANESEQRKKALAALFKIITDGADDELRVKAFQALVQADRADLKREEVALKKQAMDDAKRFRLLEFLRGLPPGELAKITADYQRVTEAGREDAGPAA